MTVIRDKADGFKALPIREIGFDHSGFMSWLNSQGAEIGIPTNPYEIIRYRLVGPNGRVRAHVIYRKDSGFLTWPGSTSEHYRSFLDGGTVMPIESSETFLRTYPTPKAKSDFRERTRLALLNRDGGDCWFCGMPMGDDVTVEHLVPKSKGGLNGLANYALAHRKCNNLAGDMPLAKKIDLRNRMRAK
jgi:hypothetical protein